jgi:PAS domain S-box-containing protein
MQAVAIDSLLPPHVRHGDADVLRRARLVVAFVWALIPVGSIFAFIHLSAGSTNCAAAIAVAVLATLGSLGVMRWTGSCFVTGNLITATLFGTLTVMGCRMGGDGAIALSWYTAVPVVALATVGRRSAVFWLALGVLCRTAFFAVNCSDYTLPNDLTPQYYELFKLLSAIGLIVLVLALALLYEMIVRQTLAELRRAEDKLLEEKSFSDLAIASLPGVFYLFDDKGRFVRWNENVERVSGYSPEELSKMQSLDFFSEEDQEVVLRSREDLIAEGQAAPEACLVAKDGTAIPYLFSNRRVVIGGKPHFIGTGIDITDRKQAERMFRESEKRFRDVFNTSADAILIFNTEGVITWVNPAGWKMYGYTEEEMTGLSGKDIVDPGYYGVFDEFETQLANTGRFHAESIDVRKDGTRFNVDVHGSSFQYMGEPHLLAIVRDITERKRGTEERERAQRVLQKILESMPVGVAIIDKQKTVRKVNSAALTMMRYDSEDQVLGRKCHETLCSSPADSCPILELGEEPGAVERMLIARDKTKVPVLKTVVPLSLDGEDVLLETFIDITERKQAEEERGRLLHDMNERIKEQTCMHEVSRSILLRETLEEIFRDVASLIPAGRHHEEGARGKIVFEGREFVAEAFEETEWKQVSEIVVDGKTCGRVEVYYLQAYPVAEEGPFLKEERRLLDAIAHSLGGAVARRRAEQKMQDYAAALERGNLELEELNRAVVAANQAKTEFLANMSHEIRTPMTAILGFAELFLGEESASCTRQERANAVATIKRNGEYLLQIINDILDLSKIEAGRLDIERITCSPMNVVADVASLMGVRANAKGLPLEIEYASAIPESILCDPTRLRQILINLVGNAIKFTETGSVRLVTRFVQGVGSPARLQFDVVDTGIGMTKEQSSKLFLPFTQADASTTRKFGGTGLGLAISQRLAELLGGQITVHSVSAKGSTFSLSIPTGTTDDVLVPEEAAKTVAAGRPDIGQPASSPARLDCRILLVEDGPDNQRLISFLLEKAGADVTLAENGQIAVEKALAARDTGASFDVILMDMQMPVMDGYTATSLLRDADYTEPILALTANAMAGDGAKCCEAGCDDYATKPIERAKLFASIAQFLAPAKQTTADRSAGSDT